MIITAIAKCQGIKSAERSRRSYDARLSYFLGVRDLQDTSGSYFSERVPSCDTENRTFELRKEFNRKKAQILLRPTAFSPYAKQGRESLLRERPAIKIFM